MTSWTFEDRVRLWKGQEDGWVYVSVPHGVGEGIRAMSEPRRGFGSVKVEITLGASTWRTSVFPTDGTYMFPLKRAIREAEHLDIGDAVTIEVTLV